MVNFTVPTWPTAEAIAATVGNLTRRLLPDERILIDEDFSVRLRSKPLEPVPLSDHGLVSRTDDVVSGGDLRFHDADGCGPDVFQTK